VRARIEVLLAHKQAVRRAAAFLALPQNAAMATRLTLRSVDAMWRAAGDRATDFSYYTKRVMLSGVYGATLLYWLSDSSEGNEATWRFLDHRIEDVMRIEKFRGSAKRALAKLPDPFGLFSRNRKP
jgi:ubiquinone biosynthesis protein COQ9